MPKKTTYTPVTAGTRGSRQGVTVIDGKLPAERDSWLSGQAGKAHKAMKKNSERAKDK
jgi:hypothetical protein